MQLSPKQIAGVVDTVVVLSVLLWYVYAFSSYDERGRVRFFSDIGELSKLVPEGRGLYVVCCYIYYVISKGRNVLGLSPGTIAGLVSGPAEELMRAQVWGRAFLLIYEIFPKSRIVYKYYQGRSNDQAKAIGCAMSLFFHAYICLSDIIDSYGLGADPYDAGHMGIKAVAHACYNACVMYFMPEMAPWALGSALSFVTREYNTVKETILTAASATGRIVNKDRKKLVKAAQKFDKQCKRIKKQIVRGVLKTSFATREPASWIKGFIAKRRTIEINGKRCLNYKPEEGVPDLSGGPLFSIGSVDFTHEMYSTEMFSSLLGNPQVKVVADEEQFDDIKSILNGLQSKGIDLNIRTGLDKVFNPVNSDSECGVVSSFDVKSMLELLDISPDIPGLCKAIMYIVIMGEVRRSSKSTFVNVLTGISQTAVLYRVFTKFELYTHLNKLTDYMLSEKPEYRTEAGSSTLLDLINACFSAYFASSALSASTLADLGAKLSKAKTHSTGLAFGVKTVSDYLSYVLNMLLGSDCSLVDGDTCLVKVREMTKLAVKYIRTEGQAAVGLKKLAECRVELESYRALLLKDEANPNRTVLLQTCVDMIKNISVLADTYDTSAGSAGLDKKMVVITIAGKAGIGKSQAMQKIAIANARYANRNNESVWGDIVSNPNQYMTVVKQGTKYLDMTAQTATLIVDDAEVFKRKGANESDEIDNLTWQTGTSVKPKTDGASIESKNLAVSSTLMLRGTNVTGPTLKNQVTLLYNHPDAYKRRVWDAFLAYPAKEFASNPSAIPKERLLSRKKLLDHLDGADYDDDFQHMRFVPWDLFEEVALGDEMTYQELEDYVLSEIRKREEEHEARSRAYYDSNVKAFKKINPKWIPPVFQGPCQRTENLRMKYALTEEAMVSMKKGYLSEFEKGTEEWALGLSAYIERTLDLKADTLSRRLLVWTNSAVSTVWGFRRQIMGALLVMGTYSIASAFLDQTITYASESGAPKPVNARKDVIRPSMLAAKRVQLRSVSKAAATSWEGEVYGTQVGSAGAPTIDVATKLLSNMFAMKITMPHSDGTTTAVPLANGFQSGKVVWFPSHYLPTIDAYFAEYPKATVDFCFDDGKSYSVDMGEFDSTNLMTGTLANDMDDFTSMHLKSAPNKSDIRKYFMTSSEMGAVIKAGKIRVVYAQSEYQDNRKMVIRNTCVINAFASSNMIVIKDEISKGKWGDNEYGVARVLHAEKVVSSVGHCGNFYVTDTKVVAMHVSASPTHSVGILLTRDDLNAHIQFHSERDLIAAVSESLPVMQPLPEDYRTEGSSAIGVVKCSIPRMTVRTVESPLSSIAPLVGLKGEYEVMRLDLASQQLCLLDRPFNIRPINGVRLECVVAERLKSMSTAISHASVAPPVGRLNVCQVIDGVPDEGIAAMNRSSSMGYMGYRSDLFGLPSGISRASYLGEVGACTESKYYESICVEVERFFGALAEGNVDYNDFPLMFVCAIPKDEFRKVGKATRMVYCYTPLFNIAINVYFLRPVTAFKAAGLATNVAYINPHAQAWELFEHLTAGEHDPGPITAIDLDYSAWDTQLHPVAFRESLKTIAKLGDYTGRDAMIVASLISVLTGPVVLVAKDAHSCFVMKMHAGLASGSPVTSVGNSLANDLLLGYGVSVTGHHLDPVRDGEMNRLDHMRSVTHGDDLVAVADKLLKAEGFGYSTLAGHMSELGLRPQPITKDGNIVEYRPLISHDPGDTTSIEFLCRNFVMTNGVLHLANKNETNAKQLLFRNAGYNKLDKKAKEARWNEFFVEVAARGEKYYNKYQNTVYPALMKDGLAPVCGASYNVCLLNKARVVDSMMWI